jgi:hypothetical protein
VQRPPARLPQPGRVARQRPAQRLHQRPTTAPGPVKTLAQPGSGDASQRHGVSASGLTRRQQPSSRGPQAKSADKSRSRPARHGSAARRCGQGPSGAAAAGAPALGDDALDARDERAPRVHQALLLLHREAQRVLRATRPAGSQPDAACTLGHRDTRVRCVADAVRASNRMALPPPRPP